MIVGILSVYGQAAAARLVINDAKTYSCSGVIRHVNLSQGLITIHHKEIPNFMAEMTMDFSVRNTNELTSVSPGQEISFKLLVLPDNAWIEGICVVGISKEPLSDQSIHPPENGFELKPGDPWPDAELLAEDGRSIHFSDFRGQAVAFNFFFLRCPLPNYCPLLNRNFAEARKLLSSTSDNRTNYSFLSISFDPEVDTPKNLSAYARTYREGDARDWLFAAAPYPTLAALPAELGLVVKRQGGSITHNLRTVVLDPQGRVYRQFDGNNWTAQELANAMKEANQTANTKGP